MKTQSLVKITVFNFFFAMTYLIHGPQSLLAHEPRSATPSRVACTNADALLRWLYHR